MINQEDIFIKKFFSDVELICKLINKKRINNIVEELVNLKKKRGRVFFVGVGGSAANCSHAVNDFRKLCNIESYTPTDNISEFTARTNDDGFEETFTGWLKVSNLKSNDALFILSVGGGNKKKKISLNIIKAIQYAKFVKAKIFSIVGKNDGYAHKFSNEKVFIPIVDNKLITPYSESFQSLIWHCIVSHPKLQVNKTKW